MDSCNVVAEPINWVTPNGFFTIEIHRQDSEVPKSLMYEYAASPVVYKKRMAKSKANIVNLNKRGR